MVSSATDSTENATCSRPRESSRWLHRARTIPASDGDARPSPAAARCIAHVAAPSRAQAIKIVVVTAAPAATASSTRCWPYRSLSRPATGVATADPIAYAAATAPATPYEPVTADT